MFNYQVSAATAAQRRVPLFLVDATDGLTAETGEAGGQPQISKNGGAFANTSATLTAIGNGAYYVELTAAELDTAGFATVRFKSANTAEAQVSFQVVNDDPFNVADAIWDEALEGSETARQSHRLMRSALVGKLSGAASTTIYIRDAADTKARITTTVDADGNRTAVTTDAT